MPTDGGTPGGGGPAAPRMLDDLCGRVELVQPLPCWGPNSPMMLDDMRGGVEDVPEGVFLPAGDGVPNRPPDLFLDRPQLSQGKLDGSLVPLVQLQPVGKLRGDLGHGLALGLGQFDGVMLLGAWHRVTPGA